MGDEGGFAPNIGSNEEGLNLVNQAIEVTCQQAFAELMCSFSAVKKGCCFPASSGLNVVVLPCLRSEEGM